MKRKEDNYLDKIPAKNPEIEYQTNEEHHIVIMEKHEGICDRLCQFLLKKPKQTKIELDQYGSYIWEKMNGQKTIYEIGKELSKDFGPEIELLYQRMALFIKMLEMRKWIYLQ